MARFLLFLAIVTAAWGANLVPDAGFESPVPYSFDRKSGRGTLYFVDKAYSASAAAGTHVLLLAHWAPGAERIPVLTPPFRLTGQGPYAFSAQVRSRGAGGKVRVALCGDDGKPLLDLATCEVDGADTWALVTALGMPRPEAPPEARFRLGWLMEGDGVNAEMEFDQVALIEGDEPLLDVRDNTEYHVREAEALANGTSWVVSKHSASYTAGPPPSGPAETAVLTGSPGVTAAENRSAEWPVTVSRAGDFRLWVHFHHTGHGGGFTVTIVQDGEVVASRGIDETAASWGTVWSYAWAPVDAVLAPGPVTVRLERPASGCSWVGRRVDLLLLTDDLDYQPDLPDLVAPLWVQWQNTATSGDPYVLWWWIRHRAAPWWGVPGDLSRAGNNAGYYPPRDRRLWVGPGQSTPWVRLNPYLMDVGHNLVQVIATRVNHAEGYVTGEHLSGVLRFAVGDPPRPLREIPIDQDGARIWLTMPGDVAAHPDGLKTGWDWFREARGEMDRTLAEQGPLPKPARLNMMATFALNPETDDHALVAGELQLLKDMGFNNLYHVSSSLDRKAAGFLPIIAAGGSLHYQRLNHCYNQPDEKKIQQQIDRQVKEWGDRRDEVVLWKDADERGLDKIEHTIDCPVCAERFREWLRGMGLTLDELAAGGPALPDWNAVKPAGPKERAERPALYYWMQRFRIESYRRFGHDCQARVQALFPNAHSYNNISPPVTWSSWIAAGNEPYGLIRDGQGMAWSEDWTGYGVSPMHIDYLLSMLRVACRPENKPIGMYVVVSSGPAAQLRTKIMQAVAAGVTHYSFYSYGPTYAGLDDWSARYDRYPIIRDTLADVSRIEAPLAGMERRPATVALLYNRTAGIWEAPANDNSTEMDAQFVYWALRYAGCDVDVIPEEDVEAGLLDSYRTIYVGGHWLRRETALGLARWVYSGADRALVGLAGVGERDEYDRPLDTFDKLFGVTASTIERQGIPSRPQYELPGLKPLGTVTAGELTFNELAWRERITTDGAEVLATTADGTPALIRRPAGKGTVYRFACLPGLAYLHGALHRQTDDGKAWGDSFDNRLRDLIALPVAPADRLVASDRSLLAPTMYEEFGSALLFLVDHAYEAPGELTIVLPGETRFSSATAGRNEPVRTEQTPAGLKLTLTLDRNTETLLLQP